MKKTTDKTTGLFIILLAIALVLSVGIAHTSAAMGYLGKATVFRGHPEILGVQSEDPRITFRFENENLDALADFANPNGDEFPILETHSIYPRNGSWLSAGDGKDPIGGATFQVDTFNVEVVKNIRCHLLVEGNNQLASSIRCGIVTKDSEGTIRYGLLNGLSGDEGVDISHEPYSVEIPDIYANQPVSITAYLWVDKDALDEAGIYTNSDMEVSLIFY